MKKLFYTIIAFAGILAASCTTDADKIVFDPSSSVAPELGTLPGTTLASDGADLTFEFTQPTYNIDAAKLYTLYISDSQDFTKQEKLAATVSGTTVTVKQSSLNSAILNLGGVADAEFTVYLRLDSWVANNKNVAVETSLTRSNVISAKFVPYNQLILDKDVYDHVWVQGDYCGWNHDKSQFLYNYSKDGKTFTGVVDFGEKASGGIKFTSAANWDEGNWGSEAQAEEAEAKSIQLVNGAGSQNIICYSKRFYGFTLDKNSLVLTKDWGADVIGIVGGFNDWGNTGLPDTEMNYNADYVRFWADVDFASDTEIKFRADGKWDYNWGKDCGGDNLPVSAGKYRIYLDLNKKTVELSTSMYGKDEPSASGNEPEPEKPAVWSLCGTIGGDDWKADVDMTNIEGEVWIARSVSLTASDEFKLRFGHDPDWKEAAGGTEANSKSTIDPKNPYDVFKPVLGTAFAAGGMNIQVGVEGVYDVTYDNAVKTILVENHKALFSLIGSINGSNWGKDFVMTQDGDVWTSPVVTIDGEFKIRYDFSWADANTYGVDAGTTVEIGKEFTLVQPGGNIMIPEAGDYKVIFNAKTLAVTIQK